MILSIYNSKQYDTCKGHPYPKLCGKHLIEEIRRVDSISFINRIPNCILTIFKSSCHFLLIKVLLLVLNSYCLSKCFISGRNHQLTSHQILNPNVTNKAAVSVIVHMKMQTITSTNAERKLESRPL